MSENVAYVANREARLYRTSVSTGVINPANKLPTIRTLTFQPGLNRIEGDDLDILRRVMDPKDGNPQFLRRIDEGTIEVTDGPPTKKSIADAVALAGETVSSDALEDWAGREGRSKVAAALDEQIDTMDAVGPNSNPKVPTEGEDKPKTRRRRAKR